MIYSGRDCARWCRQIYLCAFGMRVDRRDESRGLGADTGGRLREDLCLEAAEAIEGRPGVATPIDPVR
jgi:hypothetical protein